MTEDTGRGTYLLTEFYIEFMGSLVPGLFALVLSLGVVSSSLYVLCRALRPGVPLPALPWENGFGLGTPGLTAVLLVAAYVLGYIFYRQDPKIPDWRSAERIYLAAPPRGAGAARRAAHGLEVQAQPRARDHRL